MAKSAKSVLATGRVAEQQLRLFIGKFAASDQARIRSVRRALRQQLAGAYEFVYDNYNFFVIGYGPSDRPSEAVISIAAQANRLALCFLQGAKLPDPQGVLRGGGRQVRNVPLESAADLRRPEIQSLLRESFARAATPLEGGPVRLIIRSVSKKQRPRRKPAKATTQQGIGHDKR
jgi:hypothetical protein